MNKENIVVVKTIGGEYYIGEFRHTSPGAINLDEAREIKIMPSMKGMSIGFMPVNIFDKSIKSISINYPNTICYSKSDSLPKELIDNYMSEVSGITIATNPIKI